MNLKSILEPWKKHYENRLKEITFQFVENEDDITQKIFLCSNLVKDGNHPRLFFHGKKTKDVLVLTHGLSDSPWYVEHIAKRFFAKGVNVLMPLLPANGLKNPDIALEDFELDSKWQTEIDKAVEVATNLGERISIGGFSTGGTLSYNKILRTPDVINGGLFLFAAALSIGKMKDTFGRLNIIQNFLKKHDGKIVGIGQDPYKYPIFPKFGGTELAQIIAENKALGKAKKIPHPVFSAHSAHDETANIRGIVTFLQKNVSIGEAFIISQNVRHAETPLEVDVPIDYSKKHVPEYEPKANPQFDDMMDAAVRFFERQVTGDR